MDYGKRIKAELLSKDVPEEVADEILTELEVDENGYTIFSEVERQVTPIGCLLSLFEWSKSKLGRDHWERRYKEVEAAYLAEEAE